MRHGLVVLAAVLLAAPVGARAPAAQEGKETKSALESDPAGWISILPEKELAGWTRLPIPPGGQLGKQQWSVDAGNKTLLCAGDGGHDWLRFDRELADFIYHVEWRYTVVEGKTGYNSGVYVRNSADARLWHQAQVGSGSGGFLFGNTRAGGLEKRFNQPLKEQRVKPAGEWNVYEMTCRGKAVSLWVNGAVTCEWLDCEVPRGYVGLEGEGWRIEFKNILIKVVR